MYRLTTDTPSDNFETSLNLFYVRDGDVFVRGGGDAPDYADISLTDFIREVAKMLCPDMLLPESAEEISFAMAEYLFDGYEEPTGLIAMLYTAAWAYAELRERLKSYEDSGLSPTGAEKAAEIEKGLSEDGYSIERMVELMRADKEGRVIVLPCKVGEPAYWVHNGIITDCRINRIQANRKGVFLCLKSTKAHGAFRVDVCLDKTVFLTREEAEKSLSRWECKI